MGSKILTLADAFDAMTTNRPYRKSLTLENTLEEIRVSLYRHFDPKIVKSFLLAIKKDINGNKKMPIFSQLKSISSIHQIEKQIEATMI
jgi:HD-GYP domain-containing protein (c-di-GMP phosphodiesterase class II)